MLILTLKPGGEVLLEHPQGTVRICLADKETHPVRLAIDAPKTIDIHREMRLGHPAEEKQP